MDPNTLEQFYEKQEFLLHCNTVGVLVLTGLFLFFFCMYAKNQKHLWCLFICLLPSLLLAGDPIEPDVHFELDGDSISVTGDDLGFDPSPTFVPFADLEETNKEFVFNLPGLGMYEGVEVRWSMLPEPGSTLDTVRKTMKLCLSLFLFIAFFEKIWTYLRQW